MRILLTGKNGQVGYELRRSLSVLGEVLAFGSQDYDLSDISSIKEMTRITRPDVIVNSAAYTSIDKAEKDKFKARAINAVAPSILAAEAVKYGSLMVHLSTDYVFDGTKNEPYSEYDQTNPLNVYGLTKLEGEIGVQKNCSRHLILRTSWVAGVHGNNFLKSILRLSQERDTLNVVDNQFGAPTSAHLISSVISHLVRQAYVNPNEFAYGLYHATASGETSWHQYARYIIEKAHQYGKHDLLLPNAIRAVKASEYPLPAKRPLNSRLDTSKLIKNFSLNLPDWKTGIDEILEELLGELS